MYKKNKPFIALGISLLMTFSSSHSDVYFKNDFEPNITDCANTVINLPQQNFPNNYYIQTGSNFGEPLQFGGYSLTRNQFSSLYFIAPETQSQYTSGTLQIVPPGNAAGPSSAGSIISISECQGDFSTHLNQDNCRNTEGFFPLIDWTLDTEPTEGTTHCLLIPGKAYYINILHSNDVMNDFQTSTCSFEACGVLFRQLKSD